MHWEFSWETLASWSKARHQLRRAEARTKQRNKRYTTGAFPPAFSWTIPVLCFFDLGCHKWKKKTNFDLFTVWRKNIIINSALICWVGSNSTMFNFRLIGCSPNAWNPLFPVYIYIIFDHFEWDTHGKHMCHFFLETSGPELFQFLLCYCGTDVGTWCLWLPCCFLPCHRLKPHLAGEQTWRNIITAKRTRFFPWSQPLFKGDSQYKTHLVGGEDDFCSQNSMNFTSKNGDATPMVATYGCF